MGTGMKPRLVLIHSQGSPTAAPQRATGGIPDEMVEDWLAHLETVSRLTRAKFLSLVDHGFTEEQALELCKEL